MNERSTEPGLGTVIGGCRLEEVIGRGGMGVVYLAEQEALRRKVAVKVIAPSYAQDIGFRQRFERESRLAAAIDHPNIVPVYSAGEEDGRLFIVMRYVRGTDLRGALARDGALAPARAARITVDLAAALDAAHAAGLVHRDVKPANVLLASSPDGECAYLTDFGLTKDASSQSGVTLTGQWVGTLDYIAPEQLERGTVDARTDIYALGCVLFEMAAGTVPYAGTDVQKMWAHVNLPPPSLADTAPGLDPIVRRAMAKDPDERFPSAGDLARAVAAAVRGTEVHQLEQTVATGAAAPDAPVVIVGGPPPAGGQTRAEPGAARPAPLRPAQSGSRPRTALFLAAVALIAAGAVAGVLLAGGGDESADRKGRAKAASLTGSPKSDRLTGTDGDDVIRAGAGNDRVQARDGDDRIDGGKGADNLNGGDGDDTFADSEDDAVDVVTCGPGRDLVTRLDARDVLARDCEEAGWTVRAAPDRPFENRIAVAPTVAGNIVSFEALCRVVCEGSIELRTPASRQLLGSGAFELRAGKWGPVAANLNSLGAEQLETGRNVRVVLRANRACDCPTPPARVNSGFTTRIGR